MENNEKTVGVMPMKLDVIVKPIKQNKNLIAFANVTINKSFAVNGLKIMTGEKGFFVNMPSTQDSKGEYRDVCFPITADFRKQLVEAVLEGYVKTMDKMQDLIESTPQKPSITGQLKDAVKSMQSGEKMAQVSPQKQKDSVAL